MREPAAGPVVRQGPLRLAWTVGSWRLGANLGTELVAMPLHPVFTHLQGIHAVAILMDDGGFQRGQ